MCSGKDALRTKASMRPSTVSAGTVSRLRMPRAAAARTRVLAETGQQLLADADVITIPTTHATWAAITRRYG